MALIFYTEKHIIDGYKTMQMIRKGQVKHLASNDAVGQIKFINKLFGIVA